MYIIILDYGMGLDGISNSWRFQGIAKKINLWHSGISSFSIFCSGVWVGEVFSMWPSDRQISEKCPATKGIIGFSGKRPLKQICSPIEIGKWSKSVPVSINPLLLWIMDPPRGTISFSSLAWNVSTERHSSEPLIDPFGPPWPFPYEGPGGLEMLEVIHMSQRWGAFSFNIL